MTSLYPPKIVRGMKELCREQFKSTLNVPVLKIDDICISKIMAILKKYLLKLENFKAIQNVQTNLNVLKDQQASTESNSDNIPNNVKNVFLNPCIIKNWSDLEDGDQEKLNEYGIMKENFQFEELQLNYTNWRADEILKAVLPIDKESLTGFSTIGHIVHVNLRDHQLEYKSLIGQVLLDKVKNCKTVVNKTQTIENTYRNFQMEVLCGENNFTAKVNENKCFFEFDFSQVYWNPRLCTEHGRIINMLRKNDVLFDVFAGVGPFCVPALRKKCIVYGNDLNPASYKWLLHNVKLNKVTGNNFKAFNLDGRDFIENVFSSALQKIFVNSDVANESNIYITMNLPALAVEFLPSFRGVLKQNIFDGFSYFREPIVHLYCFAVGDNPNMVAKQLVEKYLGCELGDSLIEIFNVRNVSPKKEMMRVSFRLPKSILLDINHNTSKRKRNESESENV